METKENNIMNAVCEENQLEGKFFSEYEPIEVNVETKKPGNGMEIPFIVCGLSSILY